MVVKSNGDVEVRLRGGVGDVPMYYPFPEESMGAGAQIAAEGANEILQSVSPAVAEDEALFELQESLMSILDEDLGD